MDTPITPPNPSSFRPRSARPMLLVVATVVVGWGLLVAFILYGNRNPTVPQSPAIGKKFERLQLQPLLGAAEPLHAKDLSGKVVLLNFWGPWCTYCRLEMPALVKIYERHKDDPNFRFVSVSCDANAASEKEQDLREESDSFVKSKGYDFAVHRDQNGFSRQAVVELAQLDREGFMFPMTLILDRDGAVRGIFPGYSADKGAAISSMVDELLKGT